MRRIHQRICAWALIVLGTLAILGSPSIGLSYGSKPKPFSYQTVYNSEQAAIVQASVLLIPAFDIWLMSGMMLAGVASMFAGVHWSVILRQQ
jgi:hypothetical protein